MHLALLASLLAAAAAAGALAMPAGSPGMDLGILRPPNTTIMTPSDYTITIDNADCPCQRSRLRYCTRFRRERVLDGHCYPISHYAESMRVYDPLITERNRLSCKVYRGLDCDGVNAEMTFRDNVLCREPRFDERKVKYRSFTCHHEGW